MAFFTRISIAVFLLSVAVLLSFGAAAEKGVEGGNEHSPSPQKAAAPDGLAVKVQPVGFSAGQVEELAAWITSNVLGKGYLRDGRYRLLTLDWPENPGRRKLSLPPKHYRALYYDYANNKALAVEGNIDGRGELHISEDNRQPLPSPEEYDEAVSILREDDTFGRALRLGLLVPGPAMPPVLTSGKMEEKVDRTINVQLLSPGGKSEFGNEIVGVNMVRRNVARYTEGAPADSTVAPQSCGIPNAGQHTTFNGAPGQYRFTVEQNGVTLWEFIAVRPAASAGNPDTRSGLELREVKYRGKKVLRRINTPIINTNFANNTCGPFREWQWQEGMFQAEGRDLADGVRDCGVRVATTAPDTGADTGNFRGIAFYRQGNEIVLVSELNSGWSRFKVEYRLDNDGTIRPRFGSAMTGNSCACSPYTQNVYWRLDFDLEGAVNTVRPAKANGGWGKPRATEFRYHRQVENPANWLVQNPSTLSAYMIRPNLRDGASAAGAFGRGDLWFLQQRGDEISDTTCAGERGPEAKLNCYLDGEPLRDDLVVWYGGHFNYNNEGKANNPGLTGPSLLSGNYAQGPDLVPVKW